MLCSLLILKPREIHDSHFTVIYLAMIHYFIDDDTAGQFFHSKHFPSLTYFIQTGFDAEVGFMAGYDCGA